MQYIFSLFIFLFCIISNSFAETQNAQDTFNTLDKTFVNIYNKQNAYVGQNTYPILIVTGFNYTLYTAPDKSQTFNGLVAPFNELKAVSHIGPALYAIGLDAFRDPQGKTWQESLIQFQVSVKNALNNVDKIDWSNPAWPNNAAQLQMFMHDSLQLVDKYCSYLLKKRTFTLADYQTFSQHYMHTMIATMFLADLANTKSVLLKLNQWKKELGPKWDDLYVLILGTKGRTTSELTIETNTAAITVASLMNKDLVKSHIIIMPGTNDLTQARNTLGAIINTSALGRDTFRTERAKVATGIFKATQTSNVPLAKENVQNIVTKDVQQKKIELPQFNLLSKDKTYLNTLE